MAQNTEQCNSIIGWIVVNEKHLFGIVELIVRPDHSLDTRSNKDRKGSKVNRDKGSDNNAEAEKASSSPASSEAEAEESTTARRSTRGRQAGLWFQRTLTLIVHLE